MSCNGCRVLRKGCSESCVLRTCLQWIESPEAQGHATVFVAKFFGRAGLMSFISAVPESHRPALFQSLLFEACGRTINPVTGAVGLLWTGNWHVCQAAVDTVLRGGCLRPMPELEAAADLAGSGAGDGAAGLYGPIEGGRCVASSPAKKRKGDPMGPPAACDLDLCLTPRAAPEAEKALQWRPTSPSMTSEGSVTTSAESAVDRAPRLLNLFV